VSNETVAAKARVSVLVLPIEAAMQSARRNEDRRLEA
jgi:hypothetical protein